MKSKRPMRRKDFFNLIFVALRYNMTHTEVPRALRESGIGTRLVLGTLADIRARGLKVRPQCSFVRHVIARHPEVADLVV